MSSRAGAGGRSACTRRPFLPLGRRAFSSPPGSVRPPAGPPRRPACPSPERRGTSAASPPDSSTRRTPPRPRLRRSARCVGRSRCPPSLPLLQVLVDDVEEALPALPLALYPIRGLG